MHFLVQLGIMALSWAARKYLSGDSSITSVSNERLEKLRTQTSAYGIPIPLVWGIQRLARNVIWTAPIKEVEMGYKSTQYYEYYATVAIGICAGPIEKILTIRANGKKIYDITEDGSDAVQMDGLLFSWYPGSETQEADPLMVAYDGADVTPAYRGLCYIVFRDFPLADYGDALPQFEFDVATNATEALELEPLDDVIFDASDAERDNIVFFENNIFCLIASDGTWFKYNVLSDVLILTATHSSPEIPFLDSGFDIDELDRVHTIREGSSGFGWFCRLDGDTLALLASDDQNIRYAYRIRVFRSTSHPYLVAIPLNAGVGEKLRFTNRDTYTFGGGTDYVEIDPPTDTEWTAISLDDDNGVIWAVCAGIGASDDSYVVKITVASNGSYTQEITDVSAHIDKADEIMYDPTSNVLLVGSSDMLRMIPFDADTMTYNALAIIDHTNTDFYMKSAFRRGVVDGHFYYSLQVIGGSPEPPKVIKIDIDADDQQDPVDSWQVDDSSCPCYSSGHRGGCYSSITYGMILACIGDPSYDYVHMRLDRGSGVAEALSDIVTDICALAGITSASIDVSALTNILVKGYVVNDRMSARDALQPLMDTYFVDAVDTGGKIKFVVRGGASVVTIPKDDLAAHIDGSERSQVLTTTRQQELELPRAVEITYIDANANYAYAVQRAERQITESDEVLAIRLPIVLDKDEAMQVAVKTLLALWTERNSHMATVSLKYAYLDPADVITITEDDVTHSVRIIQMDHSGMLLTLNLVDTAAAAYESDDEGTAPPTEEEEVDYPGPTLLVLIDCPLVVSANNKLGIYVCTLGYTGTWSGASVFKNDSGIWGNLDRPWMTTTLDATIGKAVDVLADVTDPWIWDNGNSVNIRLLDNDDSLSTATKLQVLNGSNIGILGDEIIQWITATLESDGSYTLSGLLRGRKGTDWATGSHETGEYFVLLDETTLTFVEMTSDDLDENYWYRAASFGEHVSSGTKQAFTSEMRSMMPLSVQHVRGTRNDSGDLTITWMRRTRLGGEWLDGGDVPLGETAEVYSIDIIDSGVVRTLTSTTESVTYMAAQQTTDFGSVQDPVTLKIFQVSSVVGRGFETEATV